MYIIFGFICFVVELKVPLKVIWQRCCRCCMSDVIAVGVAATAAHRR